MRDSVSPERTTTTFLMANSFAPPTDCTGASAGSWLLGRRAGGAGAPETAPDGARGLFPSPLRVGSCGAGGTAVPALALSLPEVAVGRVRLARGATWRPSSRPPPASGAATIPDINATRCRTISTARSTTARSDHRPSCSPTMPPSKASNVIEIRRKRRKRCRDSRSAACCQVWRRSFSRNHARMPHCLRWGGMASLLGGLGDRFPQHNR